MGHRDLLVTRTYRPIYKPSSIGHAKRLPQGFVQVGLCSFMVPGPRGEQPSFPSTDWGQFPSTGSQISIKTPVGPRRNFIAFPGLASAPPLHDLIESFEIRPSLPIREIGRRLQGRHLLRHRGGHELVDTRSVLPAQPLYCLFERPRQPQRICSGLFHLLILAIASRGSRTSTPN